MCPQHSLDSKTIGDRDMNRLVSVVAEKDQNHAFSKLIKLIKNNTSLLSLHKIKSFLRDPVFQKRFPKFYMFKAFLDYLNVSDAQWAEIESISYSWAFIHDNPYFDQAQSTLVQKIAAFWGATLQDYSKVNGLWVYKLNFPSIRLHYFDEDVYLLFVRESQSHENQFQQIQEILFRKDALHKISLLIVFNANDSEKYRALTLKSEASIVVFDESDCVKSLLSNNSKQIFCQQVSQRLPVRIIQPYQTKGKVRSRMFYGREQEMRYIANHSSSNFMIFGGRRIGKSSLLHQLEITNILDKKSEFEICSVSAQAATAVETSRNILRDLKITTGGYRGLSTFNYLMRNYLDSKRKVIIMIDEVDELIHTSLEEQQGVFEIFNNLNSDYGDGCRFIVTGYRDLAVQCMDISSRFYNFGEKIKLGSLSYDAAKKLIEEPLCNELGFRFTDDSLVDLIINHTGKHPSHIQVFCKELSEFIETKNGGRKIFLEDVQKIKSHPEVLATVTENFYINFTYTQKLIVSLVVLEKMSPFSIFDMYDLLKEYGYEMNPEKIFVELRLLEMFFVLEQQSGGKYAFSNSAFPEILENNIDLINTADYCINQLLKEG